MFSLLLTFSLLSFAGPHQHKAHEHGSGKLSIAFDQLKGKLIFESPSESIYGFEYVAKSKADINRQTKALDTIKESIAEMVTFENKLHCQFQNQKTEIHQEKNHSSVEVNFDIQCALDPVGSKIVFNIQKFFPNLKDVDVQLLVGDVQKSIEAKKTGTTIEIVK